MIVLANFCATTTAADPSAVAVVVAVAHCPLEVGSVNSCRCLANVVAVAAVVV